MQIAPDKNLEHLIRHFLIYHPSQEELPLAFFSDGSPGIVIPLEGSVFPKVKNHVFSPGELLAYGLFEHYIDIPPLPLCGIIIVVLQPHSLSILCKIPARKIKNSIISFTNLFGREGKSLQQALQRESSVLEIIAKVEGFFHKKAAQLQWEDQAFLQSLSALQENKGIVRISDLIQYTSISERQLERKFKHYIGISPKKFTGILRMNHYLKLIRESSDKNSLVQAAVEAGFYDQSHLNNNFKLITGISPITYLKSSDPLAMNLFAKCDSGDVGNFQDMNRSLI
jgi:AraC-like DNA-binding protein